MAKKDKKPNPWAKEGVKDSDNREDVHRQDKRPRPAGPSSAGIDRALADGTIEPDPETPKRTPND